jgi:uncharacterized damage-inducible protein DinB
MTNKPAYEQFSEVDKTSTNIDEVYLLYCRRRLVKEYLPKIEQCLGRLTDVDIWWRPNEASNSIGNLVLHLSGNVRQWIVAGLGGGKDERNRPQEFSQREAIPREELLDLLRTTLSQAESVLAGYDPSRLLEVKHIQKYDITALDAISHVVEHFAQHTGQIIYITKLRKGVDLKFYDL